MHLDKVHSNPDQVREFIGYAILCCLVSLMMRDLITGSALHLVKVNEWRNCNGSCVVAIVATAGLALTVLRQAQAERSLCRTRTVVLPIHPSLQDNTDNSDAEQATSSLHRYGHPIIPQHSDVPSFH
jgi:hypothetical protein